MDYRNHLQAFLNLSVKAEKKTGKGKSKYVYGKFKKFYDYEKEVDKVRKKDKGKSKFSAAIEFMKKGE